MRLKFEMKTFCLFILFCASSAGAQTVEPPKTSTQPVSFPGAQARDERYRIGFQDTLDVQIFRHPELAQKVSVNSNGSRATRLADVPSNS